MVPSLKTVHQRCLLKLNFLYLFLGAALFSKPVDNQRFNASQ